MNAADDAKRELCVGRRATDIPNLSYFDMTFDPPCYVSGYWELVGAAVILAGIKIGTELSGEEDTEPAPVSISTRSGQDGLNMQLKWPGADGGDADFFPEGGSDRFDAAAGSLRKQILDNSNIVQGKMAGYQKLRPSMKRAFAAVSRDGTDNGWIETREEFETLMKSVGEELPEDDYARLFKLCQNRDAAFSGQDQRPGSVVFEQWVAVVCETAAESKGESEKPFFGLF